MTLNTTAIEWCDRTWNPVTGCLQGCPFCYARKIAHRFNGTKAFPNGFNPTFYPERLPDPVKMKKPQVIFVCSMADLFGSWVPHEWIEQVINSCMAAPQHSYIFLTKNPDRMKEFFRDKPVQKNFWLGTSCGENKMSWERVFTVMEIDIWGWNTLVLAEPLKTSNPFAYDTGDWFDWMIVGMQTNPLRSCDPLVFTDTIEPMVEVGIPVFMKDSVRACFPNITIHREYPLGVRHVS